MYIQGENGLSSLGTTSECIVFTWPACAARPEAIAAIHSHQSSVCTRAGSMSDVYPDALVPPALGPLGAEANETQVRSPVDVDGHALCGN